MNSGRPPSPDVIIRAMADRPSPRRSPRHHPVSNDSHAAKDSPGYFAPHPSPVWSQIKDLDRYLRRKLVKKDQKQGIVYVAKQAGTNFCKVGFAGGDAKQRLDAINKCAVDRESSYCTPPIFCAWRAEHILHKLLYHSGHIRERCSCHRRNREWFQHNYQDTIRLVQSVYSWLRQKPYDMDTKELSPEWQATLLAWMDTQKKMPLGWNDFFLIGPGEVVLDGLCYTTMPTHEPVRQLSLIRHKVEVVEELLRKDLAQNQTRRVEVLSGNQDVCQSPISTSSEIRPQIRSRQPSRLTLSEHWIAAADDLELIASRTPQSVSCNQQEFDVEKITAHMPGAFPADKKEQASFIISDVYELPGSSCVQAELVGSQDPNEKEFLNDAYHLEAGVSRPNDRDLQNLVSDVLSITDRLLLQEATIGLKNASSMPVIQSAESTIEAPKEMPADSSFQNQIAPAQIPVGSPHSETTQEPCITLVSKLADDKTNSDENPLGGGSPSVTENDDQSLLISREISRELQSLREESEGFERLDVSAINLAAVDARCTDPSDDKSEFGDESEKHAKIKSWLVTKPEDVQCFASASALAKRKTLTPRSPALIKRRVSGARSQIFWFGEDKISHDQSTAASVELADEIQAHKYDDEGALHATDARRIPSQRIKSPLRGARSSPGNGSRGKIPRAITYRGRSGLTPPDGVSNRLWIRSEDEDPRADHNPSGDNEDLRRENVPSFAEDEDSRADEALSENEGFRTEDEDLRTDEGSSRTNDRPCSGKEDSQAHEEFSDSDDEESSNQDVVSPSKYQDLLADQYSSNYQDFRNEDFYSSPETQYWSSSLAPDFMESEEYELSDSIRISEDDRTISTSEIRRLGAAYRCH